jgi:hypothetical protein
MNTNVVRLFAMADLDEPSRQVGYYDPGVGTFSSPSAWTPPARTLSRLAGLACGRTWARPRPISSNTTGQGDGPDAATAWYASHVLDGIEFAENTWLVVSGDRHEEAMGIGGHTWPRGMVPGWLRRH